MDVVGHEAIGPDLNARLVHLLGQKVAIDVLVAILEKDRFTSIAPRRDMMRTTGDGNAGEASDDDSHNTAGTKGECCSCPRVPCGDLRASATPIRPCGASARWRGLKS